ncbi:MAG: DsbA family protein [Pseudomonadota bacterium]
MTRKAEWFFDFISPYAYLQFCAFDRLPGDVEIVLRPVLFAGLLNHWGQLGPAEIPAKKGHTGLTTWWRARQRGIPFRPPPRHPFNPLSLLRLAIALDCRRDVVAEIFTHVWAEGQDGQDAQSLANLADKLKIADLEALTARPAVKQALRDNTDAAIALGVYGVPTFAIDGRLFWGDDMADLMLAWLQDPAILDEEGAAMASVEPAADRRAANAKSEEPDTGWSIHHVNLPATDVRASARFYAEVIGLIEGRWTFPPAEQVGHISADPARLTLFPTDTASKGANAGLHLIRPEPEFARKNGLDHNPSIGGHVAIQVADLDAVVARLTAAGIAYSFAPTFAIPGMRHVYVYDPSMNLLEINEMRG